MIKQFEVNNLDELNPVAQFINDLLSNNTIILFDALMGAGKTTLISKVCDFLNIEEHVSSPTYAIYNEYFSKENGSIFHFDCYRLKDEYEALDSGIEEILDSGNICLIEWPEKIKKLLPDNFVEVKIEQNKEQRLISIHYEN